MSGHWPPEWDDPEEEFSEETDQADTEAEARLSEVSAYLASVPAPVLPAAVESRISAALAAEAAARTGHAAPAGSVPLDGARKLEPSGTRARARRHRNDGGRHRSDGGGPRRGFRVRPLMAAGSLGACLLLAGLGYAISQHSPESTFSSSPSAGSPAGTSGGASSAAAAGSGAVSSAAGAGPQYAGAGSSFVVTASGTKYQRATLAEQVRTRLGAGGTHATSGTTVPAASASATSAAVPSQALRGCVAHLTNGVPPRLVDQATYEGEPAYIIASSSHVWVVGPGCTAAKTEVVASVPLAG
jgi:hypothetical protein